MLKKYLYLILPVIFVISIAVVVIAQKPEQPKCVQSGTNWECTVGGSCTNGNLLVYKENIINDVNVLCLPAIKSEGSTKKAIVDSTICQLSTVSGGIKVRADCDEGQSIDSELPISLPSQVTLNPLACSGNTISEGKTYTFSCKSDCDTATEDDLTVGFKAVFKESLTCKQKCCQNPKST